MGCASLTSGAQKASSLLKRNGAALKEVVAIDSFPDSVRRFNICRNALNAKATAYLCNTYDLNPSCFGTFDIVLFYGVLYHLRHPLLALERILSVCTETLLMQTYSLAEDDPAMDKIPEVNKIPMAKFHPFGIKSGPKQGNV